MTPTPKLVKSFASGTVLAAVGALCVQSLIGNQRPLTELMTVDKTPPIREGALGGYANIVDRVAPSVVSIAATKTVPQPASMDPRLHRFFGLPSIPQQAPQQQGAGSGVILTTDGYIVTNNHVVADADKILVSLSGNKKPYPAEIVGVDPDSDLAVLKIEATELPTIVAADSSTLKVGDTVLALGSPFGLSETVTTGIVSALGRNSVSIASYENFIQTDASINPGNSGGALVDNKGRLIGINTAILSRSGGNVGIGFAIPVNMVMNVADQLIQNGEMKRGYLGVLLRELTPDLAEAFQVPTNRGVLIDQVFPDTPAADAGLRDGDVLLNVDGTTTDDVRATRLFVSNRRPGSKLSMTVQRGDDTMDLDVTIGQLPSKDELASNSRMTRPGSNSVAPRSAELLEGVTVEDLNERYRESLQLDSEVTGIVVTEVAPDTPASKKGLKPGDVITEIGRQMVSSVDNAREAYAAVEGDLLLLRVWRDGVGRFVAIKAS